MKKIRIGLVGVGNAASCLIQSLWFKDEKPYKVPRKSIGGYRVKDMTISCAFDVSTTKVGQSLVKAIYAAPNNSPKLAFPGDGDESFDDIIVQKGPVLDGISETGQALITEDPSSPVDVVQVLKETNTEIVVCLLPSGADQAVSFYADAAIKTNAAFINGTPTLIGSNDEWIRKFKRAGLPVVGDDLQSQVGGTRIHKGFLALLDEIGTHINNTYQLDVSGGAEGLTTLDSPRKLAKRAIKTESIRKVLPYLKESEVASGTTDYLSFLENQRISHFWIDGNYWMDAPIQIDMLIRSFDGPNAAGTLVDVIRATKLALQRAIDGALISVSAFGFKHPPVFVDDHNATIWFDQFIDGKRLA